MENQLPNFPVQSQNYVAPNLAPIEMPGGVNIPKFNLNKKWLLIILVIFLLIALPVIAYFLGKQQGSAEKSARLAQTMNSINITPTIPTATPIPTPTLTPVASNSGTLVATGTASWKTYTNTTYGITLKYPTSWFPQDMTSASPTTGRLALIDFFANGTTPSISTEGHQGNELLNLNILNIMNGNTVVTQTKEQFLNYYTNQKVYKLTTISSLPVAVAADNNAYYIWYNNKIQLSIFSNDVNDGQKNIQNLISTLTITPTQ